MARTAKGSERRAHILGVARRVLADEGVDGFVLRGIADRADLALGNLQYYFPTRAALLAAVVRHEFECDLRAIEAESAAGSGDDPGGALSTMVRALLYRWLGDSQRIYLSAGAIALYDSDVAAVVDEVWATFYAAIADAVKAIDTSADVTEVHVRALSITALLDGASLQRPALIGLDPDTLVTRTAQEAIRIAQGPTN